MVLIWTGKKNININPSKFKGDILKIKGNKITPIQPHADILCNKIAHINKLGVMQKDSTTYQTLKQKNDFYDHQ
ncbi:hypothetical protein GCM10027284_34050 [Cyclobacterium sediminis]